MVQTTTFLIVCDDIYSFFLAPTTMATNRLNLDPVNDRRPTLGGGQNFFSPTHWRRDLPHTALPRAWRFIRRWGRGGLIHNSTSPPPFNWLRLGGGADPRLNQPPPHPPTTTH